MDFFFVVQVIVMEAVKEAVRKIKSLVIPHADEKDNGIVFEIKLNETDQRVEKWGLDPSLVCIVFY